LAGEKRSPHTLVDLDTLRKILLIDDHIGTAIAGLHADARKLIDEARLRAQINRLSYDEPISIQSLVVNICDIKQAYTQAGGYRPFGVSLLVGGIDHDGPQLFTTDPSGSFWGWKATAIGKESDVVRDFFKENYDDKMDIEAALKFAMEGLLRNGHDSEEDLQEKAKSIEIGRIDTTDKTFKILSNEEVEAVLAAK
ncbi:MAG: archaeal proteasome endopeptidase complex subunit alpha, partial [Candidatus Hermodarchaeota archaeon]